MVAEGRDFQILPPRADGGGRGDFERFRFGLGCGEFHAGERFAEDAAVHLVRAGNAEEVEDRGGDIHIGRGQGIAEPGADVRAGGDEGVVDVVAAEGGVGAVVVAAAFGGEESGHAVGVFSVLPAKGKEHVRRVR